MGKSKTRVKKTKSRAKPPARKNNVVSIVGEIERRKVERAGEEQKHERIVGRVAAHDALTRWLEGIDFDAELAHLRTFPPEESARPIGECRSARALRSCLRGDVAAGLAEWAEVIAEMPDLGRPYELRASFFSGRDDEAAIRDLDKAIEISPKAKALYQNRGLSYTQLGDHARAVANYRTAAALDPGALDPLLDLGKALIANGDDAEAARVFTKAIVLAPEYVDGRRGRAQALVKTGDHAGAIRDLDVVLRFDAHDTEALFNRANCYKQVGRLEPAIADLEKLVALEPTTPLAYRTLGNLYLHARQLDRAVRVLSRAIAMDPDDATALGARATAYLGLGRVVLARADAAAAVRLEPDDPTFLLSDAVARTLGSATPVVLAAIDEVIDRFPDFEGARMYRETLSAQ